MTLPPDFLQSVVLRTVTFRRPSGLSASQRVAAGVFVNDSIVRVAPDPLLAHLPPLDRRGLFFCRWIPRYTLLLPFVLTHQHQRFSIRLGHGRRVYIVDESTANMANHASACDATCKIVWIVDGAYEYLVLMTLRDCAPGWRVTFTYRHPPQPCIRLPPRPDGTPDVPFRRGPSI